MAILNIVCIFLQTGYEITKSSTRHLAAKERGAVKLCSSCISKTVKSLQLLCFCVYCSYRWLYRMTMSKVSWSSYQFWFENVDFKVSWYFGRHFGFCHRSFYGKIGAILFRLQTSPTPPHPTAPPGRFLHTSIFVNLIHRPIEIRSSAKIPTLGEAVRVLFFF